MKNLAALACATAVIAPITILATPAFAAPTVSGPSSISRLTDDSETGEQETETPVGDADDNADDDAAGADDDADEDADDDAEDLPKVLPNRQPEVAWVKQVKSKGDDATVLVKYRCWGGEDGTIWVSLSQGGELKGKTETEIDAIADVAAVADVVYDTDARKSLDDADCNGRWQVDKFKLGSQKGILRTGKTYVEYTLTDGSVEAPSSIKGDDLVKVKAKKVKAPKKGKDAKTKAPKKGKRGRG